MSQGLTKMGRFGHSADWGSRTYQDERVREGREKGGQKRRGEEWGGGKAESRNFIKFFAEQYNVREQS